MARLPWLDVFMEVLSDINISELRLRGGFCTLSQENSTHLGHGWMSQVLDDKLERHFFTQSTWEVMHMLPKETGEHGQRLFSSQTAQELSEVLFPPVLRFTPFKSHTNFRTIITLL